MTDGNPLVDDTNLRIVQMLADGKTQREIGETLFLSPGAVKARIHRMWVLTKVQTSQQLVAVAIRQGWIS